MQLMLAFKVVRSRLIWQSFRRDNLAQGLWQQMYIRGVRVAGQPSNYFLLTIIVCNKQ